MAFPLAIRNTGLVSAVGFTSAQCCAAFRAKLTNVGETRFADAGRAWIQGHQVDLGQPWRGATRLVKMAALAIEEALHGVPRTAWQDIPLLLCVAEPERPARTEGLDASLPRRLQAQLGAHFRGDSRVVAQGRTAVAVALAQARTWVADGTASRVLVAATDSLLSGPTLAHYDQRDRLLTPRNSNGFLPGEAAGALLVGHPVGGAAELVCAGIGFGQEPAHIDSDAPLRADGMAQAFRCALAEAGCAVEALDFRIADLSGEHYYFKEAALALSRVLHTPKETFDLWHPAECIGETGAAAGIAMIAAVQFACAKRYAPGPGVLAHMANDAGQRAALVLRSMVLA